MYIRDGCILQQWAAAVLFPCAMMHIAPEFASLKGAKQHQKGKKKIYSFAQGIAADGRAKHTNKQGLDCFLSKQSKMVVMVRVTVNLKMLLKRPRKRFLYACRASADCIAKQPTQMTKKKSI